MVANYPIRTDAGAGKPAANGAGNFRQDLSGGGADTGPFVSRQQYSRGALEVESARAPAALGVRAVFAAFVWGDGFESLILIDHLRPIRLMVLMGSMGPMGPMA